MKGLGLIRCALSIGVAAALLAGCGVLRQAQDDTPPIGAPGDSWMLPEAGKRDLLYVSGYSGGVYVYSYPDATLVGTLHEGGQPQAPCSDANGDVWIPVDEGAGRSRIVEYAHGGTKRIAVLRGFGQTPRGCAVDSTTGNLAVANYCGHYTDQYCGGPGEIAIYKRAKGRPHEIADTKIGYYWACAYDDNGDLFVDGTTTHYRSVVIAELQSGKHRFVNIALKSPPTEVGGIDWDGHDLAAEDPVASTIYQYAISGKRGTKVGDTPINDGQYITGFAIDKGTSIVPDYKANTVGLYPYPQGGSPSKTIAVTLPTGVTISVARFRSPTATRGDRR